MAFRRGASMTAGGKKLVCRVLPCFAVLYRLSSQRMTIEVADELPRVGATGWDCRLRTN
jgi:hypothetical protein